MDLRFQTFGQWLVLGKATGKGKEHFWVCQCSCNIMAEIHGDALLEGRARSCGCQIPSGRKDITGQQFGAWLVLTFSGRRHRTHALWVCQCRCGTRREIAGDHLRAGTTTHCGCLRTTVVRHRWYGRLFTLTRVGTAPDGYPLWRCQCRCGATCMVSSQGLRYGHARSCGCLPPRGKDLRGQVFGRLTVLEWAKRASGPTLWRCQCACGATCTVLSRSLSTGNTRSCGCLYRERAAAQLRQWHQEQQGRRRLPRPCARCGTIYPRTSAFFRKHGRPRGKEHLGAYCKPCARLMDAAKYAARRKARLEAEAAV
jgi:hypothetical protein